MALDPVTAGLDLASTVIGKIWPDKTAQQQAELAAAVTLVQGQLAINQVEAASPNIFTAGWRPFIGWVCGAAFAWNWIGLPITNAAAQFMHYPVDLSPADLSTMMPVLLGMLGLGALRTTEKIKGVA